MSRYNKKYINTKKGNAFVGLIIWSLIIWSVTSLFSSTENKTKNEDVNSYKTDSYLEGGYDWASDNYIDNFQDCQDQFGTGYDEDECNRYVKDNYTGHQTFGDYECTEDCSGHEAGYQWAEGNGVEDVDDCGGNSDSFIEGCYSYVEENY